jgi:hypothetical protein
MGDRRNGRRGRQSRGRNWNRTGYVLRPHHSFDIRGWRKSLERVAAFFYDTYSNLVAMGVIKAPRIASPFPGRFVPDPR